MGQAERMDEERMKDVLRGVFTGLHACLNRLDLDTYMECANLAFTWVEAETGWTKQEIADWQAEQIRRKVSAEHAKQLDLFYDDDVFL
jgi:hypothetical protein